MSSQPLSSPQLPGEQIMDEAAQRIGLTAPWEALVSTSPRLHCVLCSAGYLISDFPRYPPGTRLVDACLNSALATHFSSHYPTAGDDFESVFRRLVDQVAQLLFLEVRSGDLIWDPTSDAGLSVWREGREPLEQRHRTGLIPDFIKSRDAIGARLLPLIFPAAGAAPLLTEA